MLFTRAAFGLAVGEADVLARSRVCNWEKARCMSKSVAFGCQGAISVVRHRLLLLAKFADRFQHCAACVVGIRHHDLGGTGLGAGRGSNPANGQNQMLKQNSHQPRIERTCARSSLLVTRPLKSTNGSPPFDSNLPAHSITSRPAVDHREAIYRDDDLALQFEAVSHMPGRGAPHHQGPARRDDH